MGRASTEGFGGGPGVGNWDGDPNKPSAGKGGMEGRELMTGRGRRVSAEKAGGESGGPRAGWTGSGPLV